MDGKWSPWSPFTPEQAALAPAGSGVYVLADGRVTAPERLQTGELPAKAVTFVGHAGDLQAALAVHFTPFEAERNKRLAAYVRRGGLYVTYLLHDQPQGLATTLIDRFDPPCNR